MFFWKTSFTYPKIDRSGAVISDEHDQPGIYFLIDKIESPQGRLIPVLKGKYTSIKYHVTTIFVDPFF